MVFKMTIWVCALLFTATMYNVVSAYNAMGAINVQGKFQQIGLLDKDLPLPPHKPAHFDRMASN